MMPRVFRVQHMSDGRGPFRPGFSQVWCDVDFAPGQSALPTWLEEFGRDLLEREGRNGEYFGCATRTIAQLYRWFSETERMKLAMLGYVIASIKIKRVLAESQNQLVFSRGRPLHVGVIVIPWVMQEAA